VIFDFFRKIYGGLFLNPVSQIMCVTVSSAEEDERPTGNVASNRSRKPEKRPRQLSQAPSYEASTPHSNKQ